MPFSGTVDSQDCWQTGKLVTRKLEPHVGCFNYLWGSIWCYLLQGLHASKIVYRLWLGQRPFQNLQSDWVWLAHLQGLPDHGQEGLEPVRSQFRVHSQDRGPYAYYPVQGWAWLLPGPLTYGADDRTKPNWGVNKVLWGMKLVLGLSPGWQLVSQQPGCKPVFSKWLPPALDGSGFQSLT